MALDTALNSLGIAKAPADTRVVVAMSGGVEWHHLSGKKRQLSRQYRKMRCTLKAWFHRSLNCCSQSDPRKGSREG